MTIRRRYQCEPGVDRGDTASIYRPPDFIPVKPNKPSLSVFQLVNTIRGLLVSDSRIARVDFGWMAAYAIKVTYQGSCDTLTSSNVDLERIFGVRVHIKSALQDNQYELVDYKRNGLYKGKIYV